MCMYVYILYIYVCVCDMVIQLSPSFSPALGLILAPALIASIQITQTCAGLGEVHLVSNDHWVVS